MGCKGRASYGRAAGRVTPACLADPLPRVCAWAEWKLLLLDSKNQLPPLLPGGGVLFEWPLRPAPGLDDYGDHATVDRADGFDDRSCTPGGTRNKVAIRHGDGSTAWYLHVKKRSVTPKIVGDTVQTGEYLGIVGSSGDSGLPHLHFDAPHGQWRVRVDYQGQRYVHSFIVRPYKPNSLRESHPASGSSGT